MKKKLSHYDDAGAARMVDVSGKLPTKRTARAHAFVRILPEVMAKLPDNPKGNPLEIARVAGISAAKKTSELIPLCHPLMLSHVDVEVSIEERGVRIVSSVTTTGPTGVEMEALTAASVAALTVYDMTKAFDKSIGPLSIRRRTRQSVMRSVIYSLAPSDPTRTPIRTGR